jgi:hypothetical protein
MFQTTDLNSKIVSILKDYGAIPLGFLAKRLDRQPSEIMNSIEELRKRDVLEIQGDTVKLKGKL